MRILWIYFGLVAFLLLLGIWSWFESDVCCESDWCPCAEQQEHIDELIKLHYQTL